MENKSLLFKISAILWLLAHLFAVIFLFSHKTEIESDTLSLLANNNEKTISPLEISKLILDKDNNTLRFIIHAASQAELVSLEKKVRLLLNEHPILKITNSSIKSTIPKEFLALISNNRQYLLTSSQIGLLTKENSAEAIVANITKKLNSPLSSYYSKFIPYDPLLLLPEWLLEIEEKQEINKKSPLAIIEAEIDRTSNFQVERTTLIEKLEAEINTLNLEIQPNLVLWSGLSRFQASGEKTIKSEINFLSITSSLLTAVIIILAFRSLTPLLVSALSIFQASFLALLLFF